MTIDDLNLSLKKAVLSNNLHGVKLALKQGANPNTTDGDGHHLLFFAIDNDEIMNVLLNYPDIKLNIHDHEGKTLLHYAVENDDEALVDRLLSEFEVDPNHSDINGVRPLNYAIDNQSSSMVKLLIDYGAEIDNKIIDLAIINDNFNIFELLTSKYIEPTNDDIQQWLITAIKFDRIDIFDYLNQNYSNDIISYQDQYGNGVLSIIDGNDIELMEKLIMMGADINHVNNNGESILHYIIENNPNTDQIELLLNYGIDTSIKDNQGRTAGQLAKQLDYHELAELLNG